MWGNKKPDTPQAADPEPKNVQTNQPPKPAQAFSEGLARTSKDAMRSTGATADRATAWLGPSLHVKGEISGNEDLLIDGSVEGLVQLDERKLTVGTTAKLTADIFAGQVVVHGNVKGNVRAKDRIEIKKDGSVIGDLTTPQIAQAPMVFRLRSFSLLPALLPLSLNVMLKSGERVLPQRPHCRISVRI